MNVLHVWFTLIFSINPSSMLLIFKLLRNLKYYCRRPLQTIFFSILPLSSLAGLWKETARMTCRKALAHRIAHGRARTDLSKQAACMAGTVRMGTCSAHAQMPL